MNEIKSVGEAFRSLGAVSVEAARVFYELCREITAIEQARAREIRRLIARQRARRGR